MNKNHKILHAALILSVLAVSAGAIGTSVTASAADSSTAMLIGSVGDYAQWSSDASANYPPLSGSQLATVTGDGEYTVSFSIAGGSGPASKIDYLCLQLDGMTTDNYPELGITINSVSIDGSDVEYKTSDSSVNLTYYTGDKGYSRVYFTVTSGWGQPEVTDIASETQVTDNITVKFTVSGTAGGPVETAAPTEAPTTSSSSQSSSGQSSASSSSSAAGASSSTSASTTVDNSTTSDSGIVGAASAGIIAACIAFISYKKRR